MADGARRGLRRLAGMALVGATCAGVANCSSVDFGEFSSGGPPPAPPPIESGATCPEGTADCDGDPANGCETQTKSDPSNCGRCNQACTARSSAFPTCTDGACTIGCQPGFGNCDGNDENGCETDTKTTATSCGECGRDCRGAPCEDGACRPIIVADQQTSPTAIAVDADEIFWANAPEAAGASGGIRRKKKAAGSVTMSFGAAQAKPSSIAIGGTRVYWTSESAAGDAGDIVWSREKNDAFTTSRIHATGIRAGGVSVDGDRVTWVESGSVLFIGLLGGGGVDGGSRRALDGQVVPIYTTGADGVVYWSNIKEIRRTPFTSIPFVPDAGADAGLAPATELMRAVPYATSCSHQIGHRNFVLAGAELFFFDCEADTVGAVRRCSADSPAACESTLLTIASAQERPSSLAVDETHVYWAAEGGVARGAIVKCPRTGCPATGPVVLAGDLDPGAMFLAVDETFVYFTMKNAGVVAKVPK